MAIIKAMDTESGFTVTYHKIRKDSGTLNPSSFGGYLVVDSYKDHDARLNGKNPAFSKEYVIPDNTMTPEFIGELNLCEACYKWLKSLPLYANAQDLI